MNNKQLAIFITLLLIIAATSFFYIGRLHYRLEALEKDKGYEENTNSVIKSQPEFKIPTLDGDGWISEKGYYEKLIYFGTTRVDEYEGLKREEICKDQKSTQHSGNYVSSIAKDDCRKNLLRLNTGNIKGEDVITYGTAIVKIPYEKDVGGTAGMSLSQLNYDIGWDEFKHGISYGDIVIFIHGFNTSFSNAAIRGAQLAHDTNFDGEVVLYSWPSNENPLTYHRDKDRARENFNLFSDFLMKIVHNNTNNRIHIVAHSMGTYILMNSLAIIQKEIIEVQNDAADYPYLFDQIILAAPDIEKDDYHRKFSEYKFSNVANRITLYSSENDHVLDMSQILNLFGDENTATARLGDSSKSFFVIEGMDTIDARQEISSQFFGHSFYANYRSIVSDMHIILNYGTPPDNRMLQKVIDNEQHTLWFIRD